MRALVTGSEGFLGRHFVEHLTREGWLVSGVDVRDKNTPMDARDVFRKWSGPWDLVVHCAAVVNGRQTIERSPMDQIVDFELDAALFRWLGEVEVGKTVYFSSSAAYPVELQTVQAKSVKLREVHVNYDWPDLPDELYGWTKLTGERLAIKAREAGHNILVVRPFSGYGSDQDDCYPFPAIMKRALAKENPFVVWGSGQQVRDFIHVDDIVGAVMTLLNTSEPGPINIGTGRGTSMAELAQMAAKQCGWVPEITPLADEPEGVMYRVADMSTLKLFYTPRITLEEGVERSLFELRNSVK